MEFLAFYPRLGIDSPDNALAHIIKDVSLKQLGTHEHTRPMNKTVR